MKKLISWVILFIVIISIVFSSPPINAIKKSDKDLNTAIVSIYDDIAQNYFVPNTKVSFEENISVLQTLDKLKEEKHIKDFAIENNYLKSITLKDNFIIQNTNEPKQTQFYVKINGSFVEEEKISQKINKGDIVEWIYSEKNTESEIITHNDNVNEKLVQANSNNLPINWDKDKTKKLNDACDWLNRNRENSNSYLISFGIAGKTANTKKVNDLLSDFNSEVAYKTPTEVSKKILQATFCGFDASSQKYGQLVAKLSNYPDIMKQGVFGAVNALTAYDCNQYDISSSAINSRKILVDYILEYQNEDGGFCINKNGTSDIDTTAMTITALSNYKDRDDVCKSIDKAIIFIENSQTKNGGFGFEGQENSESLCTVIIALNSLGINMDDKRFMVQNNTLYDKLVEYQNEDGGFSHIKGGESSAMPTEQAIIALSAIRKAGNPYKLTTKITQQHEETPTENIQLKSPNQLNVFITVIVIVCIIGVLVIVILHKVVGKKE